MPNVTTNFGLKKPTSEEFYDVNVQNENMDIIDAELKNRVSVGEDGKIPAEHLPSMDYIPNSEKGMPNGVAILNSDGKLPSEMLSDDVGSVKSVNTFTGEVELYTYGTEDLTAGVTPLESGKLHFVYE